MAGPSATPRPRALSVTSHDPSDSPSLSPGPSPKTRRTRGTLSFLFPRPDRARTVADPLPATTNDELPPERRQRTNSRPTLLGRSFTTKPRASSRAEQTPALPSIFASLPGRTRDTLRQSYDAPRRPTTSFERARAEVLASNKLSLGPVDIPDPDTPTPDPHSFRLSESTHEDGCISPGRQSMASFARSPITSHHPMRRASRLGLDGDDLDSYRASTADLSEFLRATGPEDLHKGVPGGPAKDNHDRDGANSMRSRTRSSIFRLGGRKREKSRPTVGPGVSSNDPLPPVPVLATPGLPAFRTRDDESSSARTSFSQIFPMFGLNEEGTQSLAHTSPSTFLPPNTRQHRLPDGTTILMITTPQTATESKALAHSRSLNSINDVAKEESARPLLMGSSSALTVKQTELEKQIPAVSPSKSALKTHSPSVSISSDGTLSTTERPRETDRLVYGQFMLSPQTPSKQVAGHSSLTNLQNSFLQAQVQTPTRPRGYSSPDPVASPSPQSTPTLKTPGPAMGFSPSASIAPTPELTPQKDMVRLPLLKVDLAPVARKGSLNEAIVVDGLHFPTPPDDALTRRRPTTVDVSRTVPISPTRSSKSLRIRSPRKVSDSTDESQPKPKRSPRPLNLEAVPTYREWKTNAPSIQTQPGELTGLELDLNDGVAGPELGRKRDSLMEHHQQLFLTASGSVVNPFQTPPSPVDPFGPSLAMESFVPPPARNSLAAPPARNSYVPPNRNSFAPAPRDRDSFVPPLAGGPPLMPLPPSPSLQLPPSPSLPSPSSPSPSSLAISSTDPRRPSLTPRRSRVDSLMVPNLSSSPTSPPASATSLQTVMSVLSAQREQFDSMSKYMIDTVKSYEEEKRAFELRIQQLVALVAEKDAKAKEDERKIQGLEWLVGNLNLRVAKDAANADPDASPSDKHKRRRSSFAGLGLREDVPTTPVPMEPALDARERAKRTASMDDVIRNLGAMGAGRNIYEWAANTVLEQDPNQA
ncbi:hypothetical protein RhiJN_27031 [Ceratobasidium sp. AG-Ba]|nr:hypothetical protein RhiJN_27031 [Ceratobasidium sp. AG-Ba]